MKSEQNYQKAIQLATKAIKIDQNNIKGLFRRGLAQKQLAQLLEREEFGKTNNPDNKKKQLTKILELYKKAKSDFQTVNILEKSKNELASQKFKQSVKDIYRITKQLNGQVDLSSSSISTSKQSTSETELKQQSNKSPYQQVKSLHNKKHSINNMNKIMEEYKINEITQVVQKKLEENYLTNPLPETRAQLQRAIRELSKNEDIFIKFICRMDKQYLIKIQPTFDMLSSIVDTILRKGQTTTNDQIKSILQDLKESCKSFTLYWKSMIKKQKEAFTKKWVEVGLSQEALLQGLNKTK